MWNQTMQHNMFIGGSIFLGPNGVHPCCTFSPKFRLLCMQWKQDVEAGVKFVQQAIDIDDKCDFAHETMGTLEVQRYAVPKSMPTTMSRSIDIVIAVICSKYVIVMGRPTRLHDRV